MEERGGGGLIPEIIPFEDSDSTILWPIVFIRHSFKIIRNDLTYNLKGN